MSNRTSMNSGTQQDWSAYYQQVKKQDKATQLSLTLNKIWQFLLTALRQKDEVKIWQTSDCRGNCWWHAYHPVTGRSAIRESEFEMLAWIEKQVAGE
jgi:hypothetical protein